MAKVYQRAQMLSRVNNCLNIHEQIEGQEELMDEKAMLWDVA